MVKCFFKLRETADLDDHNHNYKSDYNPGVKFKFLTFFCTISLLYFCILLLLPEDDGAHDLTPIGHV